MRGHLSTPALHIPWCVQRKPTVKDGDGAPDVLVGSKSEDYLFQVSTNSHTDIHFPREPLRLAAAH